MPTSDSKPEGKVDCLKLCNCSAARLTSRFWLLGHAGGSAHFSHLFREACIRKLSEIRRCGIDSAILQELEQEFDRRKLRGDYDDKTQAMHYFKVHCDDNQANNVLAFTREEIDSMMREAHAAVLLLFERGVVKVMRNYKPGTCVNISGGSPRNRQIRSSIIASCIAHGLAERDIIWTDATCVPNL